MDRCEVLNGLGDAVVAVEPARALGDLLRDLALRRSGRSPDRMVGLAGLDQEANSQGQLGRAEAIV